MHHWAWDAEPALMREYTRVYLQAIGCVLRRDREWDGFIVATTALAPLSPGSLAPFLAAARDFYEVLIDGEWDAATNRHCSYYQYSNPMYSEVLRRWKRDHVRFVRNAGAPDWAGIRGESRTLSQHRPVGYFRARGQIWQPPVAGEAKAVRVLIGAAIRYMIDVAPLRERVILRLLDETGARLHEVLAMTAGGYRNGHSQLIGVRALLRNKGSLGREIKPSYLRAGDRLLAPPLRANRAFQARSGVPRAHGGSPRRRAALSLRPWSAAFGWRLPGALEAVAAQGPASVSGRANTACETYASRDSPPACDGARCPRGRDRAG